MANLVKASKVGSPAKKLKKELSIEVEHSEVKEKDDILNY